MISNAFHTYGSRNAYVRIATICSLVDCGRFHLIDVESGIDGYEWEWNWMEACRNGYRVSVRMPKEVAEKLDIHFIDEDGIGVVNIGSIMKYDKSQEYSRLEKEFSRYLNPTE